MIFMDWGKMMKRVEMLDTTESILGRAGFSISKRCVSRSSCFDIAARKGEQLAFIKMFTNIGNITPRDALELKAITNFFSAVPLFISNTIRRRPLEDDTVYERYNIYAITTKTLEDIVLNKMHPLVEAGPGGYYVSLNGNTIRETRQKLGLSIGKLAEMMSISRRTLYGYERDMTKASVLAAYNLEWALGTPVVTPIDIFVKVKQDSGIFSAAKRIIIRNRFLQAVIKKFTQINFTVTPITKAPFDFVAQFSEKRMKILGGVIRKREKNGEQRTAEIISISEVANAKPVLITDSVEFSDTKMQELPYIALEELAKIKHPYEFVAQL